MLASFLGFIFDNTLGKIAVGVVALLSFVGLWSMHERSVGADKARAQIERAQNENVRKAQTVRGASERGDARSVRDPYATR